MTSAEQILVLVPDTNVLIHGKALVDLPWADFGRTSIEVRIVSPVVKEVDQLKTQRGRPNTIARQLSSEIRELIRLPAREAVVRPSNPRVTWRVDVRTVTVTADPSLDLTHADQVLINHALTLLHEGVDVRLLTNDTFCQLTAEGVGLPVHYFPNDWLRPPESDETERENARLKTELERLKAAEPKIELKLVDGAGQPMSELAATITRWQPLSDAEVDMLMRRIGELCPPASSFDRPPQRATDSPQDQQTASNSLQGIHSAFMRKSYVSPTEEEIERYRAKDYPEWLDAVREQLLKLHQSLWARTAWPRAIAVVSNRGTRPALQALLTMSIQGALMLRSDEADDETADDAIAGTDGPRLSRPPEPPRGHVRSTNPFAFDSALMARVRAVMPTVPLWTPPAALQPDSFYWRGARRRWTSFLELTCESWRHGQEALEFSLSVQPNLVAATNGLLEVSIEATNLSTPTRGRLPVRLEVIDGSTLAVAQTMVATLAT